MKTKLQVIKETINPSKRQLIMLLVFLLICGIFSILTGGVFTTPRNLSNLLMQTSAVSIVTLGMVLILVASKIDLSAGMMVGVIGAICARLMVMQGWDTIPTIIIGLCVGFIFGCWQGLWIAILDVPAFIITLGNSLVFRGLMLLLTDGGTIYPLNNSYKAIGQNYIPGIFAKEKGFVDSALIIGVIICIVYVIAAMRKRKKRIHYNLDVSPIWMETIKDVIVCAAIMFFVSIPARHLGMPISFMIVIVLAVIFNFIAENTTFGRYVFAIGGNAEATKLSGINIKKIIFGLYAMMGVVCAMGAIVYSARINAGTASNGTNMELDAIAAAIIGGTRTSGGEGNIFGAIIGAFVMTAIDNGMSCLNLSSDMQFIVKGLVLILAVWMDTATHKKQN